MMLFSVLMVSFVLAREVKLVRRAARAVASVVGLVSAPVMMLSSPSFRLYSSSYESCRPQLGVSAHEVQYGVKVGRKEAQNKAG